MFNSKLATRLYLFLSVLFLLITSSCEIGLGTSVDIERPTITVNYPPQHAVVRDTFIIAGTCSDDREVQSVNISVRNTTTGTFYGVFNASVKNGTSWSLEMNPIASPGNDFVPALYTFSDGTYDFTIQVVDTSQKTESTKLSLDIDNTPPVFIVQNPGSTLSAEKYGAVFAVNGQTQDDHDVGMRVTFYDVDGNHIENADYESKKITTSGNTEIARYRNSAIPSSVEETEKNREYNRLTAGNAVSCSITVFDNAKEFKKPGDSGVEKGNSTTKIFLYDEVHPVYLSKTGLGLTLANIMHVLNETETIGDIKDGLTQKLMDNAATRLAIELNPVSPPTYSLTDGYSLFVNNNNATEISNNLIQAFTGGQIIAAVNAGPDGTAIDKSSIKMWIKEFDAGTGFATISAFLGNLRNCSSLLERETFLDEKARCIFNGANSPSNSSTSVSITGKLDNENIKGKSVYLILVTGKDMDGIEIDSASDFYYGFEGLSTGTSPTITISSPENRTISGNLSQAISGQAMAGERPVASIKVSESVYELDHPETKWTSPAPTEVSNTDSNWNWTWSPSSTAKSKMNDEKNYVYYAKFIVTDENGNSSWAEREIVFDKLPPVLEIKSLGEIAKEETVGEGNEAYLALKVNGNITVLGSVTESNLLKTGWKIIKGTSSNAENNENNNLGISTVINTTFNTALYPEGEFDIEFIAEDKVGNKTSQKLSDYLEKAWNKSRNTTKVKLIIDQSTDLPVIDIQNADDSITTKDGLANGDNLFASSSNLFIRASDDDGLSELSVTCNGSTITETRNTGYLSYTLPGTDGTYAVTVSAKDIYGTPVSKTFWVAVSSNAVDCSLSMNLGENIPFVSRDYVSDQTINVKGTITSAHEIRKISREYNGLTTEIATGNNLTEFSDQVVPSGFDKEKKTVKYFIENKFGQISSTSFDFIMDLDAPKISIDAVSPVTSEGVTDKTISIRGQANDSNPFNIEGNTFRKLELSYVTGDNEWSDANKVVIKTFSSPDEFYSWSCNYAFPEAISGTMKVTLHASCTDCAGNTSGTEKTITVDPKADFPVITLFNIENSSPVYYSMAGKLISGSISDDDGPVKNLWVTWDENCLDDSKKPSVGNDNGWIPVTITNGTWSLSSELSSMEDGNYKLYFYCIDANNSEFVSHKGQIKYLYSGTSQVPVLSTTSPVLISFDTSAPVIESIQLLRSKSNNLDKNWFDAGNIPWDGGNNYCAGGNENYIYARVEVTAKALKSKTLDFGGQNITLDDTNTISSSQAGDVFTYIFGPFDIGDPDIFNGITTFRFTVNTQKMSGSREINVYADNSAPQVQITYPSAGETVNGKTSVSIIASDGVGSGVSKIEYLIPTARQASEGPDSISTNWKLVSESATGKIDFTSDTESDENSLAYYTGDSFASVKNEIRKVWEIPFWFKVTDTLGNTGFVTGQKIFFDKESGIPSAEITYPGEDNAAVNGVITLSGKSICTSEVSQVHVQIDANGDGEFTIADYNLILSAWKNPGSLLCVYGDDLVLKNPGNDDEDWYIVANGTTSWNLSVNTSFCKTAAGTKLPAVSFRAKAVRSDGATKGYCNMRSVDINWDKPAITNLKLVQKNGAGTKRTILDYYSGIYIGKPETGYSWYIEGLCTDTNENTKLDSFKITTTSGGSYFETSGNVDQGLNAKTHSFSVKLSAGNLESETIKATITASNTAPDSTNSESIVINLDQTAPELLSTNGQLNLYSGNQLINENNTVQNSNTIFTFGDGVNENENGSGLACVAFYFERKAPGENGNTIHRIYDPMMNYRENNETKSSLTNIISGSQDSYFNSDNLPVIPITASERTEKDKITDSRIKKYCAEYTDGRLTSNNRIRKGGLIKLGGVYHLITDVDSRTGTITFATDADLTYTEGELVLAQIVNNQVKESASVINGHFDYTSVMNDDDDGMIETLTETGTSYTWTASIFSNNIPDGPVEIHVVALDKAGNASHGYVNTAVQNSRPRLAKVFIGTDLDGNGKFDFKAKNEVTNSTESALGNTLNGSPYGEFVYFSCLNEESRQEQSLVSLDSRNFVIKDRLVIIPDFVSGNRSIKFTYNITDSEEALKNGDAHQLKENPFILYEMNSKASKNGNNGWKDYIRWDNERSREILENYISEFGFVVIENTHKPTDNAGKTLLDLSNKNKKRYLGFTFWDETEGTVQGTNSQWAVLKFQATINTKDEEKPGVHIKPFFWNSLNDNSIYKSSLSSVTMTTDLQGHIELEEDWKNAPGYDSSAVSGISDGDPKVSGKIVVSGTAFDDVRLKSIWISFENIELGGSMESRLIKGKTWYKAAEYNASLAAWQTASSTMENDKWSFQVLSDASLSDEIFLTQDGHQVIWNLSLDTEIVQNQSQADVQLEVLAMDGRENIADETSLKMDVVPYVTWIRTNLSSKSEENPSVYSRSALGAYQVRGDKNQKAINSNSPYGEDVVIYGFNLGTEPLIIKNYKSDGTLWKSYTTATEDGKAIVPHTVNISDMKSGSLEITANGITTLNGKNYNKARGTAKNSGLNNENLYNFQANGENNNLLTDDLTLDVWEFKNGASKVTTELSNPTVRFNPVNGRLGMSFSDGVYFTMPGGNNSTAQYSHYRFMQGSNGFADSTFAYDENGFAYGAAQSKYDTSTGGNSGYFRFVFGRYYTVNSDNAYYGQVNTSWLEPNAINTKKFPTSTATEWQNYPNRIVSPQIVLETQSDDSSKVMVHIAYADTATKQIRYRRSYVDNRVALTAVSSTTDANYNDEHVAAFNPRPDGSATKTIETWYRIIKLPQGYAGSLSVGQEIQGELLPAGFVQNEHFVDISYSHYLAGSSLRDVSDYDSNFQISNSFNLDSLVNDEGKLSVTRLANRLYAADIENNRIDQNTTGLRSTTGSKPMYPYSRFNSGIGESAFLNPPDSLQNQAGQVIHVIASSGIDSADAMDIYRKNPEPLVQDGTTLYAKSNGKYKYNAGKSVALGVSSNSSPIIAWHDNENNKLLISFNTPEELAREEEKVSNLAKNKNGTGGTLYEEAGEGDVFSNYAIYYYSINSVNSLTIRYYKLGNKENSEATPLDGDNDGLVDAGVYSSTNYTTVSASRYKKLDTGLYVTLPANLRYRIMNLKTVEKKYESDTIRTTVITKNSKGKEVSKDITSTEPVNERLISEENKLDELCFNSDNIKSKGGAAVKEKILPDGKVIYVPDYRSVSIGADTITKTDGAVEFLSETSEPDGTNTVITRVEKVTLNTVIVENSVDFLTPQEGVTYGAADENYIYVSYPVYEFRTENTKSMGCATENTAYSFDRTDNWETHGKEIGRGGAYVQMKVVDDIIHLAYYEENTGAVKYTRLKFENGAFGEATTCIVDSYNDIGEYLTLDVVVDEDGNHIPYIGYFGNKRAKLAYLKNPEVLGNGTEKDLFTGIWDVCYVPTEKGLDPDRINVAVNQDKDHKIRKTAESSIKADKNDSASATASEIYGNSTTNPVMGYINSTGNLELGQKR
ncbi:MAG: Ig-like domain-containing protein [Treponema sp.]|nr:Ig-like domain-containing protein [Treponema sp.]